MCGRKRNRPSRIDSIQDLLVVRFELALNLFVALTWIVEELDHVVEVIKQDVDLANPTHEQLQRADRKMTIVVIEDPRFGCLDQKHVIDPGRWISRYSHIAC